MARPRSSSRRLWFLATIAGRDGALSGFARVHTPGKAADLPVRPPYSYIPRSPPEELLPKDASRLLGGSTPAVALPPLSGYFPKEAWAQTEERQRVAYIRRREAEALATVACPRPERPPGEARDWRVGRRLARSGGGMGAVVGTANHAKGSPRTFPFPPLSPLSLCSRRSGQREHRWGQHHERRIQGHHRGPLVTSNTHIKDRRLAIWRNQVGLVSRGSQP